MKTNFRNECDPIHPGTNNVNISLFISANDMEIAVTATDQACQQSQARTYRITAKDDSTFSLPDDLHPTTLAMLNGVALRFMKLARNGFDREP